MIAIHYKQKQNSYYLKIKKISQLKKKKIKKNELLLLNLYTIITLQIKKL